MIGSGYPPFPTGDPQRQHGGAAVMPPSNPFQLPSQSSASGPFVARPTAPAAGAPLSAPPSMVNPFAALPALPGFPPASSSAGATVYTGVASAPPMPPSAPYPMPSQQQQQQPQHQHQQQPYQQPPQQYSGFSQQPYAASVQQPLSGAALAHAITSAAAAPAAPAGYDAYPPRDAYSGAGADSLHHRGGTGSPLLATSASSPKPTGAYALGHATGGSGSGGGYGGSFGSDGPGLSPAELSHSVSGAGSPKARHNPADARQARTETAESRQAFTVAVGSALALAAFTALWALVSLGTQSVYIVLTLAVVAASLLYILRLFRWALAHESYHPDMRPVAEAIKEGSEGYLSTQYSAIALVAAVVAAALAFLYLFRANPFASAVPTPMLAMCVSVSFLLGAACSAAAGYIGVWISVRVNVRVALAASRYSYADALLLCFRGGAISSALSAQLCILGVALLYLTANTVFAQWFGVPRMHVPTLLAGYGFGAAFVALFMQLGGGIYTKAADVGADMCGKIEAGIPEDDARNPAVIADLVGDNVGDCAGSMADVFESISAEVIGTMILGATLVHDAYGALPAVSGTLVAARTAEMEAVLNRFVFFPLAVHAVNLLVSCIGIESVRVPARAGQTDTAAQDPLVPMQTGYVVSSALAVALFSLLSYVMLDTPAAPGAWWRFALCGVVGLATSFLLIAVTQYYTDYKHEPVRRIAAASVTGHGTNVISGLSVGLESCLLPAVIIAAALLSSYGLGYTSGLPPVQAGIYGAAIATMGMLSTAVYVLSMNNFGPIADNAGGIVEMSEAPAAVRAITDRLDAVGNVTKAASKGYAVGGSALACFVLFQAYLDEIAILTKQVAVTVNLARVECICAGLLAIAMIFVFAGWSMEAVGKTAQQVVHEVRRQFAARPGIMDGSQRPDYARCVTIVTKAALAEMGKPAALALGAPVAVGFAARVLGAWTGQPNLAAEVLATFLMFGTLTGLLMAVFMDNAGGAWDNAKKYIESQGLKGSEQHKASVTGDTVGDPFKDTAGPSLHVIITTMSTTVLVLGPMFLGQIVDAAH